MKVREAARFVGLSPFYTTFPFFTTLFFSFPKTSFLKLLCVTEIFPAIAPGEYDDWKGFSKLSLFI
jgi:hypothetical protein